MHAVATVSLLESVVGAPIRALEPCLRHLALHLLCEVRKDAAKEKQRGQEEYEEGDEEGASSFEELEAVGVRHLDSLRRIGTHVKNQLEAGGKDALIDQLFGKLGWSNGRRDMSTAEGGQAEEPRAQERLAELGAAAILDSFDEEPLWLEPEESLSLPIPYVDAMLPEDDGESASSEGMSEDDPL